MRSVILGLLVASFGVASAAIAEDCTMAQLQISPFSVIEPCTARLAPRALSDRDRSQAHFVRGRGYHRTKRLAQAHDDYAEAFRLDPNNEEILVSWANVELRLGHMEDYAARVEQATALAPNNAHVLRTIGTMHWTFGDEDKAIALFTQALSIDPAEPFALYFRSTLYWDRRAYKEALADANALVAIPRLTLDEYGFLDADGVMHDFYAVALLRRAELYEATGQRELALHDYDAAVATERTPRALYRRGWLLREIPQRRNEALADLEAAVALDPRDDAAQHRLGLALLELKRYEDAFAAFDVAVAVRPRGRNLRMRARLHRQFGRTDEAVRDYETAMARDPEEREYAINAMRAAGYWTSREMPTAMTPALHDAVRACMIDVQCN
jgi:tetratricopeptide (TPR) repeat protein